MSATTLAFLFLLSQAPAKPPAKPSVASAGLKRLLGQSLRSVCIPGKQLTFRADGTLEWTAGKDRTPKSATATWVDNTDSTSKDPELKLNIDGQLVQANGPKRFLGGMRVTRIEDLGAEQYAELLSVLKQFGTPTPRDDASCSAAANFPVLAKQGAVYVAGMWLDGVYLP